ncbi:SRPBCC family protein [Mesorhizobium australicum]|uniref:Carbon monoxide dehydrogenase subunit G n=1 Tax=Mesorhizobium australicum TaxID=536018 RepID=A0A1X7MTD0_9HYPH|nr:carbon monoxide dehydrogenase subunit G [Mesorhizobium australicum]SMH27591.1 hypothetical protein SAMN02982922_0576 [Mesorhizobium australicum]
MDMQGQQLIPADRETVWNALNDPEILKVCIPGCQELTKSSDTQMTAVAVIKVGPVSARFQGAVTLSDLDPPNGYTISGEGQGGVAGFAKGTAVVRLDSVDDGTLLRYEVDAQIGGKLSQLGGRLIDATAKKMSAAFFEKFGQEILSRQGESASTSVGIADDRLVIQRPDSTAQAGSTRPRHDSTSQTAYASTPATDTGSGALSFLKLAAAGALGGAIVLVWLQYGGFLPGLSSAPERIGADEHLYVSPEFASAVQLIMAAAIGYLFAARK